MSAIPIALVVFPWAAVAPMAYLALRRGVTLSTPWLGPRAGVVLFAAAVAALANPITTAWTDALRFALLACLLVLTSALLRRDDVAALAFGGGLAVAVGAGIGGVELAGFGAARAAGTMHHANVFGAALALTTCAAFGWSLAPRHGAAATYRRFLPIAVAALGTVATSTSGSRAALLALAVGMAVIGGLRLAPAARRARGGVSFIGRGAVVTLATVAIASAVAVVVTLAALRAEALEAPLDLVGRAVAWEYAAELIVARPLLGHGFTPWANLVASVEPSARPERIAHVHNSYLHLGLAGGTLLLAAVMVWAAGLIAGLWRRARCGDQLAAVALGSMAAFAILNTVETYLLVDHLVLMVTLPTAMAHRPGRPSQLVPSAQTVV